MESAYLERIFSRKALVAVVAGERFDCQVYPLVSLQVVVSIEGLWALIAFKGSVVCSWLLMGWVAHEVRHGCGMSAVEARHHPGVHANESELAVRVLNVREDRCRARLVR